VTIILEQLRQMIPATTSLHFSIFRFRCQFYLHTSRNNAQHILIADFDPEIPGIGMQKSWDYGILD